MTEFDPMIVALLCNWCAYDGADAAGCSRLAVPHQIREVRVMCSGQVDPTMVFKAFTAGADGVLVLGCRPGDCHYRTGNREASKRMRLLQAVMTATPIHAQRLYSDWISAGEGERYSRIAHDFFLKIKGLGPVDPKGRR